MKASVIRQRIAAVLAVLLLCAGCGGTAETPLPFLQEDASRFVILRQEDISVDFIRIAADMRQTMSDTLGTQVSLRNSSQEESVCEIILGAVDSRPRSVTLYDAFLAQRDNYSNDWQIQREGNKLYLFAGSLEAMEEAIAYFFDTVCVDEASVLAAGYSYTHRPTYAWDARSIGGVSLAAYAIHISDTPTYHETLAAKELQQTVMEQGGYRLSITTEATDHDIRIAVSGDRADSYTATVEDGHLVIRGGTAYAAHAAARQVLTALESGDLSAGHRISGTYDAAAMGDDTRTLVWHDEFDTDGMDTAKWSFQRSMTQTNRTYDNGADYADVKDGELVMNAVRDGKGSFILSEGVTTSERMNFRYGYLEIRANPPFKQGAWPSFWMKSNTRYAQANYMAEVDIFEIFSSSDRLYANIHKWGDGKHTMLQDAQAGGREYRFAEPDDLNEEYHIYGFEWDPTYMTFYVDGEPFARFRIDEAGDFDTEQLPGMAGFHDPMYILFNNEFYTEGDNAVTDDSTLPFTYKIDWIRLYQKPGEDVYVY